MADNTDPFAHIFNTTIGFDPILNLLRGVGDATKLPLPKSNYPHYDILKVDDETYRLDVAVAGFSMKDLSITLDGATLTIEGKIASESEVVKEYIHRGISYRGFKRVFTLADNVKIGAATLDSGILSIRIVRLVNKPNEAVVIPINSTPQTAMGYDPKFIRD